MLMVSSDLCTHASNSKVPTARGHDGHFLVRMTCSFTSLSMFFNHLSANPRSVKRSADFLARCLMAKVSSGDNVNALRNPSAYSSAVVAWKPKVVSS